MTKKDDIFFELAIKSNSLLLGDFTLKSGRQSPYFFNIGSFFSEGYLSHLASLYADKIIDSSQSFDLLFGPAYKGIPLASAVSASLSLKLSKPIAFAFDRKEEKSHGEGGVIVGDLRDKKVLVIDDVLTAGTAFDQSVKIIKDAGGLVTAGLVALDREEKIDGMLTRDRIMKEHDLEILSLARISQLVDFFEESGKDNEASIIQDYLTSS